MSSQFSRRRFLKGTALTCGALALNHLSDVAQAAPSTTLIAFFSWSGNTRGIAELLQQKKGGDLFVIEPVAPYPKDYDACLEQAKREQQQGVRPELRTQVADMARYTTIFVGHPNWWGTFPAPVAGFLSQYDFSGKTIAPFVSHGGGGQGRSAGDMRALCPSARVTEALAVRGRGGASLSADMDAWLARIGLQR